jgi:hypothetical protein
LPLTAVVTLQPTRGERSPTARIASVVLLREKRADLAPVHAYRRSRGEQSSNRHLPRETASDGVQIRHRRRRKHRRDQHDEQKLGSFHCGILSALHRLPPEPFPSSKLPGSGRVSILKISELEATCDPREVEWRITDRGSWLHLNGAAHAIRDDLPLPFSIAIHKRRSGAPTASRWLLTATRRSLRCRLSTSSLSFRRRRGLCSGRL